MNRARLEILLGGVALIAGLVIASPSIHSKGAVSGAEAAPAEKTGISWEVEPAEVVIILDDKKLGEAGKVKFTETKPGKHSIKLMLHKDETETEVVVKKGQTLKFSFQFDAG